MRPYLFLLLIAATSSAAASSTDFSLHPGESETFIVQGEPTTIEVRQGDLEVDSVMELAPGIWAVRLTCLESSQVDCEGTIHT